MNRGQMSSLFQIQRLVEMGFTREAVVEALDNTSHDIQEATNVLLSQ